MKLSRRQLRRLIEQEVKVVALSDDQKRKLEKEKEEAEKATDDVAGEIASAENIDKEAVKKALSEILSKKQTYE